MLAIRSTPVACCGLVLAAGCGGAPADKAGHRMVLDRGRFTITNARFPEVVGSGIFTVDGDRLALRPLEPTENLGEHWNYRWSLYRGVLRLRIDARRDLPTALRAAPWIKSH